MDFTLAHIVRYLGLFVVIGTAYAVTARFIPDHRERPRASITLGLLIVCPLLFGLLYLDYELRKHAARETIANTAMWNPLFAAISTYAPDAYKFILDEAAEITVAGGSVSAVQQKIRPLVVGVIQSAYRDSTDEQRLAFERAGFNVIRNAIKHEPGSCPSLCKCWQLAYADRIECMEELTRAASPDVKRHRDRITIDLVRTAKPHPNLMKRPPAPDSGDLISDRFANAFLNQLDSNSCCGDTACCLKQLDIFAQLMNGPAEQIFTVFRLQGRGEP